ncbi:hypothetical protein B4589_013575 [Halolamina sp. CBA1230]|uniref:hypothetical protein n=1 Tax=Halolamina sp. CBA1230 TaxID=1853690 RepID=UPI0009A1C021|nr:hypothetical protein [Halolamina sp. CBA1230]QKY21351.1 hypothetical protein B4589_013575 [Halolamina sp. CBA1230]
MKDRQVRLRDDHYQYVQDSAFTLSGLVREAINDVMEGKDEFPSATSRDTDEHELIRTSVTVTDEHEEYLRSQDVVFSVFVHQLIEKRMMRERKLEQLEEEWEDGLD